MSPASDPREARPLPKLLRPGLELVFIGYNPGLESARAGHYYAFRGNVFWRQLNASGLVARAVSFEDDAGLADEAGIGFTDLCERPTARADELTAAELAAGAVRLHGELLQYQPRVALFSGRGIYQAFGRLALGLSGRELAARPYGEQPERLGETVPWVIPSSSGLASRWHAERLEWLRRLAAELRGG
ncbi:MAG: mismatch-specific DNA-glycosylase [Dehalococcoidia bacterium]|nr:mismatch-specific DNA-glycosylase [Dehalococcoidia bacterium]